MSLFDINTCVAVLLVRVGRFLCVKLIMLNNILICFYMFIFVINRHKFKYYGAENVIK
uniref:Uncharacterized protein n=1 Tax=Siphoviridae sp. ctZ0X1 TaxID=2825554 RepID=A0A8S5QE03_9CAUD|nr:MAG TPA: hypothetical protein [Siphoviridae sp. ctZ0X1]